MAIRALHHAIVSSAQYTAKHPDPAPHLNQGLRLPAPGPRINPNPPAPAQHAPMVNMPGVPPVPPPQPPAPMTTLVPAMRDGSHLSPPEGEVVTRHSFDIANRQWVRHQIRVRLDKYPFQEGTLRSVYFMKDLSKPPGPAQVCFGDRQLHSVWRIRAPREKCCNADFGGVVRKSVPFYLGPAGPEVLCLSVRMLQFVWCAICLWHMRKQCMPDETVHYAK